MFSGYKTYISVAIAVIAAGVKSVFPEYTEACNSVITLAGFGGLGFLRAGIKKDTK